jgi:hypothetical protein
MLFALVALGNEAAALELLPSSHVLQHGDVLLVKATIHNDSDAKLGFVQPFGAAGGVLHLERRKKGAESWELLHCEGQGILCPGNPWTLGPRKSYCSYELVFREGDEFSWSEAGEFEVRALATGIGFFIHSQPVKITVIDERAVLELPADVPIHTLSIGKLPPLFDRQSERSQVRFHPESQWAIQLANNRLLRDWIAADQGKRPALYAKLSHLVETAEPVTAERFAIALAQQHFIEENYAETSRLLKWLPHPSSTSLFLEQEIERLKKRTAGRTDRVSVGRLLLSLRGRHRGHWKAFPSLRRSASSAPHIA